jgi:hypothetical protein
VDRVKRRLPEGDVATMTSVNVPTPWVYMTYDVWLVDEFIKLVTNKMPLATVAISSAAQKALDERFNDKKKRRRPIPEVKEVLSETISLHPHQLEAVRFFMENEGRGLLADEMGLGAFKYFSFLSLVQKQGG